MSIATVTLQDIQPLIRAAAKLGVDAPSAIGLPPNAGADTAQEIPIADYFRIQRAMARAADDLTANISSRKLTFKTGHFLVAQMRQANSLLSTMESLVEHINMMHGDIYNSLRYGDQTVSLVVDDSSFPYRFRDDADFLHLIGDCLLIKTFCLLDSLTAGVAKTALRRVRLKRKRSDRLRPQNRFWPVPVDHSHANYELVFDYEEACRPVLVSDTVDLSAHGLFSRVIGYLDTLDPVSSEQGIVARTVDLIEDGVTRQCDVAEKLRISVATHRRRLAEEGRSFRDLLLETNLRRAEIMLKRGCSVAQATEELAYSDVRAFNRAFKRWKGLTPAAFASSAHETSSN